jgi:hypothetical protein
LAVEHHARYIQSAAQNAGQDLLVTLGLGHLENERVQRKSLALRRQTFSFLAVRTHLLERIDEELLLIGYQPMKT